MVQLKQKQNSFVIFLLENGGSFCGRIHVIIVVYSKNNPSCVVGKIYLFFVSSHFWQVVFLI